MTETEPARPHHELHKRRQAVLPNWLTTYYEEPIDIVGGQGRHVWDAEGNQYLDFFGGILVTMTAHALPQVTAAVAEQAAKIVHSSTLYLNQPMIELAERIAEISGIEDPRVFFTTSGTEATDTALLLAANYRGSNQVLALRNSYHGRSFSSMAVTGNRSWSASSFSPLDTHYVHATRRIDTPYATLSDQDFSRMCLHDLEDVLGQLHHNVACLIAEPIQGVGGFCLPPDGLYGQFAQILKRHGILWISDEVQTGWGRTGEHFWGWQAHTDGTHTPDIVTFAKGLGNGLPIGGVIASADVMNAMPANSISTFGGSPLTSAGALANLDFLLNQDLQTNAARMGSLLRRRLEEAADKSSVVTDVRGKGLMQAVELGSDHGKTPLPDTAGVAAEAARRGGVLVGKGGLHGNVLRIAPPLSISEDEVEGGAEILTDALRQAERNASQ